MPGPLIAIVGDVNPKRTHAPPMNGPARAKRVTEEIGAELAKRGAWLGVLFLIALAIIPLVWGMKTFPVWILFMAPLLADGAGSALRPMVDRLRGRPGAGQAVLPTLVLGLVAGGIAGVLFVTAQMTGDPNLASNNLKQYALVGTNHPVQVYLIQAHLAGYRNFQVAHDRLQSHVPLDPLVPSDPTPSSNCMISIGCSRPRVLVNLVKHWLRAGRTSVPWRHRPDELLCP